MSDLPSQLKLMVLDAAIDSATAPPRGCQGDLETQRPCPRYQCRWHLYAQDERPGRPHSPGARPPVRLKVVKESCSWDVVNAHPEGLTADEIGEITGAVVGERVLQLEQRAMLKLKAVEHVFAVLQEARENMPNGTEMVDIVPHNVHALPNEHMVTVRIRVEEQTAKGTSSRAGVVVRRRK